MKRLLLFVLFLMSLGMEVDAACQQEVEARMNHALQEQGYTYHGAELRLGNDLLSLIGESEQLSLAQKCEIKKYAASEATEIYLVMASNSSESCMDVVVVSNVTCETIRNYRLYNSELSKCLRPGFYLASTEIK